jgi:hypothetical protein
MRSNQSSRSSRGNTKGAWSNTGKSSNSSSRNNNGNGNNHGPSRRRGAYRQGQNIDPNPTVPASVRQREQQESQAQHRAGERDSWSAYDRVMRKRNQVLNRGNRFNRPGESDSWNNREKPLSDSVHPSPFAILETLGIDDDLQRIGNSFETAAKTFLSFVIPDYDEDEPPLTQIQSLFQRVQGELAELEIPRPVNLDLSDAGVEWIRENYGFYPVVSESALAELTIDQIQNEATSFGIDLGDVEGLTTQEVASRYLEELTQEHSEIQQANNNYWAQAFTPWEIPGEQTETALLYEMLATEEFLRTFGVNNEITLDMLQWAEDFIPNMDFSDPALVDEQIRSFLIDEISIYNPIPPEVDTENFNIQQLADAYSWTTLTALDSAIDELNTIPNMPLYWDYIEARDTPTIPWDEQGLRTFRAEWKITLAEGELDPERVMLAEQYRYHIDKIERDMQMALGLQQTFQGTYETALPDLTLLRMTLSLWEPLDYVLTTQEIAGDIQRQDWGSAAANAFLLIVPGLSGWMDNAARVGNFPEGTVILNSGAGGDNRRLISGVSDDTDIVLYPDMPKPNFTDPGADQWRYQRYRAEAIAAGRDDSQLLSFEVWRERYFIPALEGGRPGRPGGLDQRQTREALETQEGWRNVENVELGGHYPDMIRPNSNGGMDYAEVGIMLQNGLPEARERAKLAEEIASLGPNDIIVFVDRSDPNRRIVYRFGDDVNTKAFAIR